MKKDKYSHAEKELRGLKLYIRNVKDRIRKDYSRTKWLVAYADRIDIRICCWNRRRHTCVVIVYDNYLWKKYHIDPYRAAATWYDKIPDDTYQPVILHMDTNGHCLGYYKIWDGVSTLVNRIAANVNREILKNTTKKEDDSDK